MAKFFQLYTFAVLCSDKSYPFVSNHKFDIFDIII